MIKKLFKKEKYNLSTMKMLKKMRKNINVVFEAENGFYRIFMKSIISGGGINTVKDISGALGVKGIIFEKPKSQIVTLDNKNPYEYSEVFIITQNVIDNWNWRMMSEDEYSFYKE